MPGSLLPKYSHVKSAIIDVIRNKQLKPGDQISSISELMEQLSVSKITVVRAMSELETEGIIHRIHGKGTFVSDPTKKGQSNLDSTSIAVIVPDIGNPFYGEVVRGIDKILRRHNLSIQLLSSDYDLALELNHIETIKRKPIRGLIISPQVRSYNLPEYDWDVGSLPTVCVDYCPPSLKGKVNFVGIDNFKGAYEATNYLLTLGHRKIAFVTTQNVTPDRISGYQSALANYNIQFEPDWIIKTTSEKHFDTDILDTLINRITAIFCGNDLIAAQILNILKDQEYRIPEDISVVGFDNVEFSRHLHPSLTTVDQQEEELGKVVARILLAELDPQKKWKGVEQVIVQPTLVIRESSSKPAK